MKKLYPIVFLVLLFFIVVDYFFNGPIAASYFVILMGGFLYPIYIISEKNTITDWASLLVPKNMIYLVTSIMFLLTALIFLLSY